MSSRATGVPFTLSSASSYAAIGVASNVIENNTVCSTALIQRASWEPHRTTMAIVIDTGSEEYENSRQCQAARRMLGKSHEGKEFPVTSTAIFFKKNTSFQRTDVSDDGVFLWSKTIAVRNMCFQMVSAGDCLAESRIRVERKKYPVKWYMVNS